MEVRELIHKYEETLKELREEKEHQRLNDIRALSEEKKMQYQKLTEDHSEV